MATSPSNFVVDAKTLQTFGELDYRIYTAIHNSGNRFLDMRVTDLAEEAHVSNATVVRFCKKCGYTGLKELKQACVLEIRKQRKGEPLPSVMTDIREMVNEGNFPDYQQNITAAFELISNAKGIVFVGHGRSAGLAVYGATLFSDMEYAAVPLIAFPAYVPALVENEAAIVISHHGTTPEVLSVTNELSSKGCRIVTVTSDEESPIARLADVCICYGEPIANSFNPVDLSTRLPTMYVIEQLARLVYNNNLALEAARNL